jgi:hypothetical protein
MDRGRATCGGQKPTAPTTRLIRGYGLMINAYYATRLGLRSMRERPRCSAGTCASTRGLGPAPGWSWVPPPGRGPSVPEGRGSSRVWGV